MGAKIWMIAYAAGLPRRVLERRPELDEGAAERLVRSLFPGGGLEPAGRGDLSAACPTGRDVLVGSFAGLDIVAAKDLALDQPSHLGHTFLEATSRAGGGWREIHLVAMHGVVDWFALALWSGGSLRRSLSLSPDGGILEDLGPRLPFEEPFWSGRHPASGGGEEEYPLPFHPLELGDAALRELFGFSLEGAEDAPVDPRSVPLLRFQRRRRWWRFG